MKTKGSVSPLTAFTVVALIVCGLVIVPRVFAKIVANTIDPVATLTDAGRLIVVTGPILNDQAQWDDIRLTITQRSTGAVAEGRVRVRGTIAEQQWTVEATAMGSTGFEPGPAAAVALATSSRHGRTDDAHQWLVPITLIRE